MLRGMKWLQLVVAFFDGSNCEGGYAGTMDHHPDRVDVGVGNKVEVWLDSQGFDTKAVRDFNPRMTDNEILQRAD